MPLILSCVNLKGGVGKTAIAVNFAAYCGEIRNLRVLLIDLDPQTNASFSSIGYTEWDKHQQERGTLADLLGLNRHSSAEDKARPVEDVIYKNAFQNVDLIPSHLDLFTVDLDLAGATGRERKLKKAVASVIDNYDIVICDCPPNLTIPTQNALALSSHYLIPVSPDFLSGLGVGLLLNRIKEFCDDIDHQLINAGVVISRVGRPAIHRTETVAGLRQAFEGQVLESEIHERVAVSQAAEQHASIFQLGAAESVEEFRALGDELYQRLELGD